MTPKDAYLARKPTRAEERQRKAIALQLVRMPVGTVKP